MRLFLWLTKWMVAACFISLITIMTTWYIINAYVHTLLGIFNIQTEHVQVPVTDVMKQVIADWESVGQINRTINPQRQDDSFELDDTLEEGVDEQVPLEQSETLDDQEDAVAVWGQVSGTDRQAESQLLITAESFNELKDQLSSEDKMFILSLFYQLPQEAVQELSLYMENGITLAELEDMEGLIRDHLDEQSFEQLKMVLQKYEEITTDVD